MEVGGIIFDGKDTYIAFAREHLTREFTYHCIPVLMYAMCMTADEVIYKGDMQAEKIHMARTSLNPMKSAVVLSVNTTILSILVWCKPG